ncbi:hypothetical protein V8C42DRAFT_339890 [Trichoderma barbatum]
MPSMNYDGIEENAYRIIIKEWRASSTQEIPEFLQSYIPENYTSRNKVKFKTEPDFDPNDVTGAGDGEGGGAWSEDDNASGDSGGGDGSWGNSGADEAANLRAWDQSQQRTASNDSGGAWDAASAAPAA